MIGWLRNMESNKKIKFVLDFDDIHPQRGYGYIDEYHRRLMKLLELGVRPTYFIVPKYQNKDMYDISKSLDWIKTLGDGEFCVHGLSHSTEQLVAEDQKHLEFLHLDNLASTSKVQDAVHLIKKATGQIPKIIRFPGWFATVEQAKTIFSRVESIEAIADNFVGQEPVDRFGMYNLPYTCILGKDFNQEGDMIICHAHISEGYNGRNENALNDKNFKMLVKFIEDNKDVLEFVTMSEVFDL